MRRTLTLAPLTALTVLLATSAASAAEWHVATSTASIKGASPLVNAEVYLTTAAAELQLSGVKLAYERDISAKTNRTVRFQQTHAGLPVLGRSAAVRLTPEGQPRLAVLEVARDLAVDPTPAFDAATAAAMAELELGETLSRPPHVELAVVPDQGGRLVYAVTVLQGSTRERRFLIDAKVGQVLRSYPTVKHALGRVYRVNDVGTEDVTLTGLVASSPQRLNGRNGNLVVTNYASGNAYQGNMTVQQNLGPNSGQDFLYNEPADPLSITDGIAQVSLYHHLTRAFDFFENNVGLDMSAGTWKVTAVANAVAGNQYMDNAFFSDQGLSGQFGSPNLIAIGQGSAIDFAADADVFIHEFGHYVSHNAIGYNEGQLYFGNYGVSPFGGAIDEGISDYFACTMNDNPVLGEISLGQYTRDLADTTKRCPDDTNGEVHDDGELIGSLGWTLRTAFGAGVADDLVWGAMTLLTADSSLTDFAKGLQATADDLVGAGQMTSQQRQELDVYISQRGLDDCDHVLDVSVSRSRTFQNMGLDFYGYFYQIDCGSFQQLGGMHSLYHFRAQPQPGDTSLRLTVDYESLSAGDINWGIYVTTGSPVTIDFNTNYPAGAMWQVENITGGSGEIVIDASSNPPFDPSQTYYMVIGDKSCGASRMTVTTNISDPPNFTTSSSTTGAGGSGNGSGGSGSGGAPGTGGASPTGDEEDPDSSGLCSVRAIGEDSDATWAGLAALGLGAAAVARSRRRRRFSGR